MWLPLVVLVLVSIESRGVGTSVRTMVPGRILIVPAAASPTHSGHRFRPPASLPEGGLFCAKRNTIEEVGRSFARCRRRWVAALASLVWRCEHVSPTVVRAALSPTVALLLLLVASLLSDHIVMFC